MQELHQVIQCGWPSSKAELPDVARPYFDFCDQLIVQDQLIFKGPVVVILAALRAEMMAKCHASHIGVEGCLGRARESMFWPRMSSDMKEYITKCDVCLAHLSAPLKETVIQHEVTAQPWAKVGADLCDSQGRTLLVVCNYFSGFTEVERLQSTTSNAVSRVLKVLFARYGIPNVLVSDNGPNLQLLSLVCLQRSGGFST